ncbi:hypothetical protein GOP47_0003326 [Adiantum capillus-veneris]|uniref:DUF4470 domain-containing protein n=1 Tax=Adiantum capillus-veneris TaxID=13818 RepID=A0A9D4VDJ8_ADICA|nr:hypothetical protein GOP47_0003326 [Adiantum capillus-veneris]
MAAFWRAHRAGIAITITRLRYSRSLPRARCISYHDTDHQEQSDDELSSMAKDLNISRLHLAEKVLRQSIKESEGKLGAGINGAFLDAYTCANWSVKEGYACNNAGVMPCTSCDLVCYCSAECKEENLGEHNLCCHLAAGRTGSTAAAFQNAPTKKRTILRAESDFVWGNIPAYGILPQNFRANGISHNLTLCFCASGDLRNVVETVCQLPVKFNAEVTIYINDHNPIIMARNFLMLKLLQTYGSDALDANIALWYSAAMTHEQSVVIDGVVIHTLKSTAAGCADKDLHVNFPAPGRSSIHVSDGSKLWPVLACMTGSRSSKEEMWSSRSEKVKSALKSDCKMACLRPSHQVAWKEFRKRGLLLPFGAYNASHSVPNKFLFHPSSGWLPHADANPLSGWDVMSVLATGSRIGLPEADIFGSFFFHARTKLSAFLERLQTCEIHLKLSCKEASLLAEELAFRQVALHCIDSSNLADLNYGGLAKVLCDWGPLLDKASVLPPSLITYFMNWLYTMDTAFPHEEITLSKLTWADVHSAVALINSKGSMCAEKLKSLLELGNSHGNLSLLDYFHDFTPLFKDYLRSLHANVDARRVGLSRRRKHLVVPHRLSVDIDDFGGIPGKAASYDRCYYDCMIGDLTFTEQFVEWGLNSSCVR